MLLLRAASAPEAFEPNVGALLQPNNFPVSWIYFPVRLKNFPVPLRREFSQKRKENPVIGGHMTTEFGEVSHKFPVSSLFNRELAPETS